MARCQFELANFNVQAKLAKPDEQSHILINAMK